MWFVLGTGKGHDTKQSNKKDIGNMNQDYFYLKLIEFILEVKDIHGSCAVLDMLDVDDIESFEKFNKIVWNYTKMSKILENENKTIKED